MPRVINPGLGLILNASPLEVGPRGLRAGMNFRIKYGGVRSLNLGWTRFGDWALNGPVRLIDNFFPRGLDEKLIFGTDSDIYVYDADTEGVHFLTPIYDTGTASVSGTAVTAGGGADWSAINPGDQIAFGAAGEQDPEADWFTVQSATSSTITLTESAGTIAAGPYTIRQVFAFSDVSGWDTDAFINDGDSGDDLWFATNGIDDIITWNGSDPTVTRHPELGFHAGTLSNYSNMMIYGDITASGVEYSTSIINSDVGLPLHAGSTGTGLSEQFVIHGGTDGVVNLLPLGDYLIAYCERHIIPIQFVGDPIVFTFRQALSGIGPISGDAIADFGDFHEFIGSDAGYQFDGVGISEVNSQVFRDVLRQTDPLRRFRVFGHFDEEQGDLIWSIPLTTDTDVGELTGQSEVAYVEHYLEDVGAEQNTPCSARSFPFLTTGFYERSEGLTWANAAGTWLDYNFAWNDQFYQLAFPLNLAGNKDGEIYVINNSQTADGAPLPSFVRFGRWAGDPNDPGRTEALLARVYPFTIDRLETLNVQVYAGDYPSGSLQNKGSFTYSMAHAERAHFASVFRSGKYFEIEFGSPDGEPWELEGYDTDMRNGGKR